MKLVFKFGVVTSLMGDALIELPTGIIWVLLEVPTCHDIFGTPLLFIDTRDVILRTPVGRSLGRIMLPVHYPCNSTALFLIIQRTWTRECVVAFPTVVAQEPFFSDQRDAYSGYNKNQDVSPPFPASKTVAKRPRNQNLLRPAKERKPVSLPAAGCFCGMIARFPMAIVLCWWSFTSSGASSLKFGG